MIPFLDLKQINAQYKSELETAIMEVLDSGWYLRGEQVSKFESNFANYCGVQGCVGVANGLDALVLIFKALKLQGKLKDGDEVIVPANTYIASIMAITENNLVPKLVEPHPDTFNLDSDSVSNAITAKTKAVLQVHLYGYLSENLSQICKDNDLILVEDAAQAHGAECVDGGKAGSMGYAAGFSFYPGKNLGALGDAGAVTSEDLDFLEIIRNLGNYGSKEKYSHIYKGSNSRLDEVQAAVLDVKLSHLNDEILKRRNVAENYQTKIKNDRIHLPSWDVSQKNHVFHLYVIRCRERDALQKYLLENRIQTVIHYPIPPHQQECYKELSNLQLPFTERLSKEVLSLPISPVLSKTDQEKIIECLNKF